MGCSGSKETDEKEIRKIKYEFKWTKVPKFDEFFNTASRLLEQGENMRSGLQDSREDGQEFSDTWKLKEYTYNDVVKVLFWSLSANAGGDIKKANVWVGEEPPFVTLAYFDGLLWETRELADTFQTFLKTVCEAPGATVKIAEEAQKLVEQGSELAKNAGTEAKNAGLNALDSAKAVAAIGSNMNKLRQEVPKLTKLKDLAKESFDDVKKLLPKFKEIVQNCDEIGKKAAESGHKKPKDLFEKYHPGPKKTPEEIEKEAKAAEELKKKREKKKAANAKKGGAKPGEKKEGEKKEEKKP